MEESRPNCHEDHIAGKEDTSLQHCNLVHKCVPMPQAMQIPAAKAAVDKEWEKLEKIPAWDLTKVRSKKKVIDEARTKGAKVHLMDIFHLKNAELETKHQKYKGRIVLRGDIEKDNSGSYAVFTEQGSSSMEDPVVPLERNLYGHPLAGLLGERQFEKILLKYVWEKVSNWECSFVQREKRVILICVCG